MNKEKITAIIYALLAAIFNAINVPVSKLLLDHVGETTMAALLYLGAGIGVGILSMFMREDRKSAEKLSGNDLPSKHGHHHAIMELELEPGAAHVG